MECPYCKKEMTKGYLYGEMCELQWLPSDRKPSFPNSRYKIMGSLGLKSSPHSSRACVKAYKCKECNKLIIDTNDTE